VIVSKKILGVLSFMACAFGPLPGGVGVIVASAASLKPIDPAALQIAVDATARELMVPGAMVLLRTPRGEFIVSYGTTELDGAMPLEPHNFSLLRQS
jgi:D-alanyl-D-alanine carboxypeptidase